MFRGYYDNPKATQESFTSDGWLRSGDVGYRNTDMLYWCTDRIKELIKVGLVRIDEVNRRSLFLTCWQVRGFQVSPAVSAFSWFVDAHLTIRILGARGRTIIARKSH